MTYHLRALPSENGSTIFTILNMHINSFIVKDQEGRTVKYPCDSRGLYVREVLPPVDCHVSYVLTTSVEGYTDREVGRAARARKLYHDLSAENNRNVKVWLRSNQCKNVPVTVENIDLAEKFTKPMLPL